MRAGAGDRIDGHFDRRRERADVHHVDVAGARRSDRPGPFLAHQQILLGLRPGVVQPPYVVRLPTHGADAAQQSRCGHGATLRPDIPDPHTVVPFRREEQAVAHGDVVHERAPHGLRPHGTRCRGRAEIEHDQSRRHAIRLIDGAEGVQHPVHAGHFGGVYAVLQFATRRAHQQLRRSRVGHRIDGQPAIGIRFDGDNHEAAVVGDLHVTGGGGVGHDHAIHQPRLIGAHVPDLHRIAARAGARSPGGRVGRRAAYPHFGGVSLGHGPLSDVREHTRRWWHRHGRGGIGGRGDLRRHALGATTGRRGDDCQCRRERRAELAYQTNSGH